MEPCGDILVGNTLPNFLQNGDLLKDPILSPLRISSNLFPPSVASTTSSSAFQKSQLAVSVGSLGSVDSTPVESPYAPIRADQNFVKSEMGPQLHNEYVEYGDWDAEADIKENLLFKGFQPNIEAMVKREILNVAWVDDDDVMPMEDSLFLRCHQFLKDEAKTEDVEEDFEDRKCDLEKGSRRRRHLFRGRRCKRQEEVGRICLRRKEDGGFEIKKEKEEKSNHRCLAFGVDNCDFCPDCQVKNIEDLNKILLKKTI